MNVCVWIYTHTFILTHTHASLRGKMFFHRIFTKAEHVKYTVAPVIHGFDLCGLLPLVNCSLKLLNGKFQK